MSNDININLTIKQGASEEEIAALVAAEVKKHTKPKFPRWEELGKISGSWVTEGAEVIGDGDCPITTYSYNRNVWPTKELAEACLALSQLAQLHDYVNGDWKPDWNCGHIKHVIEVYRDGVSTDRYAHTQYFLAFKDEGTRDGFLEAYHDLIEIAKPLL